MQSLPGFRDFYPEEFAKRQFIFSKWREIAYRYGFVEYDGPPLESLELYTKKSGDEIVNQLYHFVDKGERAVALRPEMTPTLARMVASKHRDYKKPMKWFSIPQLFRYERQQKGRLREHFQLNADIIGKGSIGEEVEMVGFAIDVLRHFGLSKKDFKLRLSSREVWQAIFTEAKIPQEKWNGVFAVVDKFERMALDQWKEKLKNLGLNVEAIELIQSAFILKESSPFAERLKEILEKLEWLGLRDFVEIDLRIVRGLAYYSGVVFEIFALDSEGNYTGRAIAGGGRYDGLLKQLAGVDLPSIGFGMGDVVLSDLLEEKGLLKAELKRPQIFVVCIEDGLTKDKLNLIAKLRSEGFAVSYDAEGRAVGKQFQLAKESESRWAIVMNESFKAGKVTLEDFFHKKKSSIEIGNLIESLREGS